MNCIQCLQKHLAAALSYSKEILNGHGKGASPDHRMDLQGEIINAEHHAEQINISTAIELKNLRRSLAKRSFIPAVGDMNTMRTLWLEFDNTSIRKCMPCTEKQRAKSGTVDIFIPLNSKGSGHGNLELRYALRCIEKNLSDYRNIFVITDNTPEWLTGVKTLKVADNKGRKAQNLFAKILAASQISNADYIVFWQDDNVLLQPLSVLKFPALTNSADMLSYTGTKRVWHRNLYLTGTALKSKGKKSLNCESHTPYLFNRERFIDLANTYKNEINTDPGVVMASLYHNHYNSKLLNMNDHKATFETKNADVSGTKNKFFLGYSDAGFENGISDYLAGLFPKKSKYEVA